MTGCVIIEFSHGVLIDERQHLVVPNCGEISPLNGSTVSMLSLVYDVQNPETMIKKADAACAANAADKEAAVRVAIKRVDQACAKGLMHKNAAARKKSQLAKKLNAAK